MRKPGNAKPDSYDSQDKGDHFQKRIVGPDEASRVFSVANNEKEQPHKAEQQCGKCNK
jgi:hypothetical protein